MKVTHKKNNISITIESEEEKRTLGMFFIEDVKICNEIYGFTNRQKQKIQLKTFMIKMANILLS